MPISESQARQPLQTVLNDFQRLTSDERKQMSEASVVRLLEEVLGWPIKDPTRYKYELTTQVGRPDLTFSDKPLQPLAARTDNECLT